jgi:hypothetical protein
MGKQPAELSGRTAQADDVKRILGALDSDKLVEIMALQPTIKDVEEASLWLAGDPDVFGTGAPLKSTAGRIVDILTADDEDDLQAPA